MSCSKLMEVVPLNEERSCAFCLIAVQGDQIWKCGKCGRRVYCRKECQVADWRERKEGLLPKTPTATGQGQGHKNWCSLSCGEEGLDWAVREIPGKGRGLVALRDLPKRYRIIVEGFQKIDQEDLEAHPGFRFLSSTPTHNVSTEQNTDDQDEGSSGNDLRTKAKKFHLNGVGTTGSGSVLGLRIALGNHACDANAAVVEDLEVKVLILFALRPIKTGEEICHQYDYFNDIRNPLPSPSVRSLRMKNRWGFQCSSDCICNDTSMQTKLLALQALHGTLHPLCIRGQVEKAIDRLEQILSQGEELNLPDHITFNLYFWAFELCCAKQSTGSLGAPYLAKVVEFQKNVMHPRRFKSDGKLEHDDNTSPEGSKAFPWELLSGLNDEADEVIVMVVDQ